MQISAAFQMEPLWKPDRVGERVFTGDLDQFAKDMTAYVAAQLERFADIRGGDLYLALSVKRGGECASHEYRSGHYVKDGTDG